MAQASKRLRRERRTRRELSLTRRSLGRAYAQIQVLGDMLVEGRKKELEARRPDVVWKEVEDEAKLDTPPEA